ncbi:diacylglycerol/lipid kinase family protein [Auraticoccus monumenti]|uniref:Diacylglycerol kinase family enzyme n=1 Tax=Auraticoccus monumenti TaxID=675864 RepID=A0A1G6W5U0_9ACTN|nr:diacylglycerol kinase family protein [Auraticoccus monumenti]SDD60587.1 Diacylglycerol kinase family enzyme [Auraticoccus monumenti]
MTETETTRAPEGEQPSVTDADTLSADLGTDTTPEEAAAQTAAEVRAADPEIITPPPKAAVIYNPTKVELEVLQAAVEAAAQEAEWGETIWIETSAEDPGIAMAEQAVAQGAKMVLAAGGDGTIRAVAQGLLGSDVSLALLPLGTGNLLARNLDLKLDDVADAVATAFAGHDRTIDAGVARMRRADGSQEEHAFLVMAGLGLDAQMIEQTDEELKKKVGWLAYAQSLVKAARGGNRIRLRVSIDGGEARTRNVHTLLVGNCGSLPGNILLLPEADITDGRFDIVMLRPKGLFGWLQIWSKVLVENAIRHGTEVGRRLQGSEKQIRALRYLTAEKVSVVLSEPEPIELDGDSFGEVKSFELDMRHEGLTVRVPEIPETGDEPGPR